MPSKEEKSSKLLRARMNDVAFLGSRVLQHLNLRSHDANCRPDYQHAMKHKQRNWLTSGKKVSVSRNVFPCVGSAVQSLGMALTLLTQAI